jgi:hypothetical protein
MRLATRALHQCCFPFVCRELQHPLLAAYPPLLSGSIKNRRINDIMMHWSHWENERVHKSMLFIGPRIRELLPHVTNAPTNYCDVLSMRPWIKIHIFPMRM